MDRSADGRVRGGGFPAACVQWWGVRARWAGSAGVVGRGGGGWG